MTMTLISTVTLSSTTGSINFTSFPQIYTDLYLSFSGRTDQTGITATRLRAYINGDNGTNYRCRWLEGTGSSVVSYNETTNINFVAGLVPTASATSNTFGSTTLTIPNYTSSNQKTILTDSVSEHNASTMNYAGQDINTALWIGTAAITSITFAPEGGSFVAGTTASIYGITKDSGGATVA